MIEHTNYYCYVAPGQKRLCYKRATAGTFILNLLYLEEKRIHVKYSIYSLSDEDEDYKQQVQDLRDSIPFAVVGANAMVDVRGKKIRGRQYPWGVIEVENPAHCDFVKLRTMLITHMQDLQEVTHDVHYENYRSQRLTKPNNGQSASGATSSAAAALKRPPPIQDDKDKQLQEKEAELRRMQEMVAAMQKQINQQSQTSLASLAANSN